MGSVELATNIAPVSRATRVSSPTLFFHLVDGLDVNHSVETIISGADSAPNPTEVGTRYLLFPNRSVFTPAPPNDKDYSVIEYAGKVGGVNQWILSFDPDNTKTNFGLLFVKDEKKFYQFVDSTTGWIPILSKGSVDGGTFG